MPNWCYNTAKISHDNPEMIKRLVDASENDAILQEFIPCPKELLEQNSPAPVDVASENIKKYGASDWYTWCVTNWGTKWDFSADSIDVFDDNKSVSISFDSAWGPPIEAYAKMAKMGFDIEALFYEPGMCFAGSWDNENGEISYEYDFTDPNWDANMSEDVKDMLQGEFECWLEYQEEETANVG